MSEQKATTIYLKVKDVADELNVSVTTVHRWLVEGLLEYKQFGKSRRVTREALDKFIDQGDQR